MSGDKHRLNGTDPAENGINDSEDIEMREESQNSKKGSKPNKDKDGDDEMTVVVPPTKGPNAPSAPEKPTEADLKNGAANGDGASDSEARVDPQEKVISGESRKSLNLLSPTLTWNRNKSQSPTTGTWCRPL